MYVPGTLQTSKMHVHVYGILSQHAIPKIPAAQAPLYQVVTRSTGARGDTAGTRNTIFSQKQTQVLAKKNDQVLRFACA